MAEGRESGENLGFKKAGAAEHAKTTEFGRATSTRTSMQVKNRDMAVLFIRIMVLSVIYFLYIYTKSSSGGHTIITTLQSITMVPWLNPFAPQNKGISMEDPAICFL